MIAEDVRLESLAARVTAMREAGKTYAQIGHALGVGPGTAHYAIHPKVTPRAGRSYRKSLACHGACGRYVAPYLVGVVLLPSPDHCGGCARPVSEEAVEVEKELWRRRAALFGEMLRP